MAQVALPLLGGCACGYLRYRANVVPLDTGYCHCRLCQRTSGAPALAWARFPVPEFQYTAGEPSVYRSSAWGERRFCPRCGTQIEFRCRDLYPDKTARSRHPDNMQPGRDAGRISKHISLHDLSPHSLRDGARVATP